MTTRTKWHLLIVLCLMVIALHMTVVEAIDTIRNETLAKFCRGEAYPQTWRVTERPAWATRKRVDALCAVTEWLREEFNLTTAQIGA